MNSQLRDDQPDLAELAERVRQLEGQLAAERQARRQLEALEAVMVVGWSDLTLDRLLDLACETLRHEMAADATALFLTEPHATLLKPSASSGLEKAVGVRPADVHAILERASVSSPALHRVEVTAGAVETVWLGAPLLAHGKQLGKAIVGRRQPGSFDLDEARLFEILAGRLALAIENAALRAQAQRDLEMQTLLLRELEHRVRNNLQAISGILAFQLSRETTAQVAIAGALRRLKSIAATQDFLFRREGGLIPLRPLLESVVHELASVYAVADQRVRVLSELPDMTLPMEQAQIVALAVHELVANAFQHGLRGRPGDVAVHLRPVVNGVEIEVIDPGDGLPPEINPESDDLGGLKLVRILIQREFQVHLRVSSQPGQTRAGFTIPLSYFPERGHRHRPETRASGARLT